MIQRFFPHFLALTSVICFLTVTSVSINVQSQFASLNYAPGWGEYAAIENFGGSQPWLPRVAVSPQGVVHALWSRNSKSSKYQVLYSKGQMNLDGSVPIEFMPPIEMGQESINSSHTITVDNYGNPHIAFIRDKEVVYMYSPNQGDPDTWVEEVLVGAGEEGGHDFNLATDEAGVPYLTYSTYEGNYKSWAWLTFRVGDGQWAQPFRVSPESGPRLVRNNRIAVTGFGPSAEVYVAYELMPGASSATNPYLVMGTPGNIDEPGSFTWADLSIPLEQYDYKGEFYPSISIDPITKQIYVLFSSPSRKNYGLLLLMSKDGGLNWSRPIYTKPQPNHGALFPTSEASHNVLHIGTPVRHMGREDRIHKTVPNYTAFYSTTWTHSVWDIPQGPDRKSFNTAIGVGGTGVFFQWAPPWEGGSAEFEYNAAPLDRFVGPIGGV